MEQSTLRIAEICKQYGLDINEDEYERQLNAIVELYVDKNEKDVSIKKEVVEWLIESVLCPELKIGDNALTSSLSGWVKSRITFIYGEDGIKASFYQYGNFYGDIIRKYERGERYAGLVEQRVIGEYELKRIFHSEEAEQKFVDEVEKALRGLVLKLNKNFDYKEMTERVQELIMEKYEN